MYNFINENFFHAEETWTIKKSNDDKIPKIISEMKFYTTEISVYFGNAFILLI